MLRLDPSGYPRGDNKELSHLRRKRVVLRGITWLLNFQSIQYREFYPRRPNATSALLTEQAHTRAERVHQILSPPLEPSPRGVRPGYGCAFALTWL